MQCNGKNCYKSEHEAKKVRLAVLKRRNRPIRVYQCGFCHHWHLTSNPKFEDLDKETDEQE